MVHSPDFFPDKTLKCFSLRVRLFCMALVEQLGDDSFLMIAYIAPFSTLLSRLTALACGSAWVTSFIARFLNIHWSGVLTALAWLVPHETAAVSVQVLCTPYNHAPWHFMQSHIRKVYACFCCNLPPALLAEWLESFTCYYSNPGWNDDRSMSQHRKLTLENKMLLLGLKPATFRPQIQRSATDWAIPMFYALCTACKQSHEHIVCTLRALSDSSWGHPVQLTRCKTPRTV